MPRQKQTVPVHRSEAERAAASWTDRDLELTNGAAPGSLVPPSALDEVSHSAASASVQVTFSDNEEEEAEEDQVITVSDGDSDIEFIGDSKPSTNAVEIGAVPVRQRKKKCLAPTTHAEEEYARVSSELAEFDFYVPVSVRKERFASDPAVGTLQLTLSDQPSELPETKKFWVYVCEGRERAVIYFEWRSKPDNTRGRRRIERTRLLEAGAAQPAETWRLLSLAAGGVEAVLRDYAASTGELRVDMLLAEKVFVPLRHPSEMSRRVNVDCRALLRRVFCLPEREYEFQPFGAVDIEALYRRLAVRRGLSDHPEGGIDQEPIPDPQHDQLLPQLRPYQRAAVAWMLHRERRLPEDSSKLHPLYVTLTVGGATVYYCPLGGWATRDRPGAVSSPPGGILADEMGLGKTVEILSLVLNHTRADVEVPEPQETVDLDAYEASLAEEKRLARSQKKRDWNESDSESDTEKRKRKKFKLDRKRTRPLATGGGRTWSCRSGKVCSNSESESDGDWERYVPTSSRSDRMRQRRARLADSDSGSVSEAAPESNTANARRFRGFSARSAAAAGAAVSCDSDCEVVVTEVSSGSNGTDLPLCTNGKPENMTPCSGIVENDNVGNCIEDVIVRECYGGTEPKDYVRGLGVIPNWDAYLKRGETSGSKPSWRDPVDESIEAVVVRVCYDGKPPKWYRPGGRARKTASSRFAGTPRAPAPPPSESKRLLQLHYEQTMLEMSACRVRQPPDSEMDPTFSCLCGKWKDRRYRVQCGSCGTFQHAECVGYDVTDPLRGAYWCPQCWTQRTPVRSGATLIVSPAAISDQWVQEIHKHIRREGLRVLVYTGVRGDRYIQPQRLAAHDLVVTSYAVLQRELNYTAVGREAGDAGKRRQQRYLPPPSPLLCVDWWRVCLDEAQMVESTTSRTATMALKLSCVNRWCVTGTPLGRSVADLYGLLLFLGEDPVWCELWWNQLVYYPYLNGDSAPLDRLLDRCLWRTAKADVLDQIGLPEQRDLTLRLDFSPVETYFYRRQHEDCSRAALAKLATLKNDGALQLKDLERSTVNQLLRPLLRLRQACCHPQVVRGQFMPLNKSTMTMEELLQQLIRRATAEAEEAHRQRIAAQHGLAALHVVRGEWAQAAELYRTVLRQAEELHGTLSTDMLQRLHALHNLDELVSARRPIPPTTRDHRLRQEAAELRSSYVGKHTALVEQTLSAASELSAEVDEHAGKLDRSQRPWFSTVLAHWSEARPGEVVERINQQLRDLSSADSNVEKRTDTGVTKRTTTLKSRVPANTMLEKFSSVTGLQRLLLERLAKLAELREETQQSVGDLVDVSPTNLVTAAVDCHLRPSGADAGRCRLCAVHDVFERYERELFYMAQSRVDASEMGGVEGKISVHGELRRGNWGDNETERVLKVMLTQARQLGMAPPIIQLGGHHIKMLDTMKREFKSLRVLWRHVNDRVSASDELGMAVIRLRTRYDDEPAPDRPVAQGGQQLPTYVIGPHELDTHRGRLMTEKAVASSELRRKLGQRLYLCNLQKSGANHHNGNPDPCPICETPLGSNWSVLQCGHCFCMPCIQRIVEEFSVGGRRGKLKCAICREITRHTDIAYVNAGSEGDDDSDRQPVRVRGSHSTKVEAVVRCVLTVLRDEPDAKTLVFATWTDALDVIAGALDANGVTYRSLHASGRFQRNLREFRTQPDISVLLLPVHSGANGLNLTEATHMVLTHPVLDPGAERQAVGRIHRIGQRRATVVHRLVIRDTIEERVLALNSGRRVATAAAATATPGSAEQGLSLAELRALFEDGDSHLTETEDRPLRP